MASFELYVKWWCGKPKVLTTKPKHKHDTYIVWANSLEEAESVLVGFNKSPFYANPYLHRVQKVD